MSRKSTPTAGPDAPTDERESSASQQPGPAEAAKPPPDLFVREIAEVAPALIYVFDIQTGARIYDNRWLPDLLGYHGAPERDMNGYTFMDRITHPDDRERLAAYRLGLRQQADNVVSEIEYRGRHADGSWRWILSRNRVFTRSSDGTVRRVIGSSTDITVVKRAEEELRRLNTDLELRVLERTADLAAANRELEAFAYSVSHDLRGPLRTIDGFTSATLESYGELLGGEGRHFLTRVRGAARHMADMIDGLLALSRTARSEFSPERLDLVELARATVAELRPIEPDRHVEVVLPQQLIVTGDKRLLRILLDNLLGNAWKFTARREFARIELGVRIEKCERIYFVRDNGAGFEMSSARTLFTPFHRLHRAEEFAGTGIGLATVRRIVARHGGKIWAESAPEKGAAFYFTLPDSGAATKSSDTGD